MAWRSGLDFLVFPLFFPVAALYIHGTDICMYEFFISNLDHNQLFPLPVFSCENPDRSAFFQERCASEHPSSVWWNMALISPPDRTWDSLTLKPFPELSSHHSAVVIHAALYSHMLRSLWYLELFFFCIFFFTQERVLIRQLAAVLKPLLSG